MTNANAGERSSLAKLLQRQIYICGAARTPCVMVHQVLDGGQSVCFYLRYFKNRQTLRKKNKPSAESLLSLLFIYEKSPLLLNLCSSEFACFIT